MLFQQGAKHTVPREQPECSPTLSGPESPQVYFSPPVYCTISAELRAHDNLVSHSPLMKRTSHFSLHVPLSSKVLGTDPQGCLHGPDPSPGNSA